MISLTSEIAELFTLRVVAQKSIQAPGTEDLYDRFGIGEEMWAAKAPELPFANECDEVLICDGMLRRRFFYILKNHSLAKCYNKSNE
jgi:hypothetical protein